MTTIPATWRIWGRARFGISRLPRYWFALVTCRIQGHRWQIFNHSAGRRGCGRCHYREAISTHKEHDEEGR